jgi:hypothetical protein
MFSNQKEMKYEYFFFENKQKSINFISFFLCTTNYNTAVTTKKKLNRKTIAPMAPKAISAFLEK